MEDGRCAECKDNVVQGGHFCPPVQLPPYNGVLKGRSPFIRGSEGTKDGARVWRAEQGSAIECCNYCEEN